MFTLSQSYHILTGHHFYFVFVFVSYFFFFRSPWIIIYYSLRFCVSVRRMHRTSQTRLQRSLSSCAWCGMMIDLFFSKRKMCARRTKVLWRTTLLMHMVRRSQYMHTFLTHAGPSVQNKYSAVPWFGLEVEETETGMILFVQRVVHYSGSRPESFPVSVAIFATESSFGPNLDSGRASSAENHSSPTMTWHLPFFTPFPAHLLRFKL